MPGPLADLTVLDLSRVLAGPYGTMVLGDFGARIIKVEQPDRGDDTRQWGPPFTDTGESAYFLAANRNKQSMTLNLKHAEGRRLLQELARRADVLVENFKVGTMDSLGLGYEPLRDVNPGLIYCAITGYGQTGPDRERPGYDTVIQAEGGIMSITGPADGEPFKVGVAIVDITAGLYAVSSILAALHHRERTGEGQFIDIALFDAQLGWLANVAGSYLVSGEPPRRYGNAHASIVPYQTVPTADGMLMLAVGNDRQFAALSAVLGRPEWAFDERYATNPARVRNRSELMQAIEEETSTRSNRDWMDLFLDADIPCGPVNDIPSALAGRQTEARDMVQTISDDAGRQIRLVGPVPKLSLTPATISSPPPSLGRHTEDLLYEFLGLDSHECCRLRDMGVI